MRPYEAWVLHNICLDCLDNCPMVERYCVELRCGVIAGLVGDVFWRLSTFRMRRSCRSRSAWLTRATALSWRRATTATCVDLWKELRERRDDHLGGSEPRGGAFRRFRSRTSSGDPSERRQRHLHADGGHDVVVLGGDGRRLARDHHHRRSDDGRPCGQRGGPDRDSGGRHRQCAGPGSGPGRDHPEFVKRSRFRGPTSRTSTAAWSWWTPPPPPLTATTSTTCAAPPSPAPATT